MSSISSAGAPLFGPSGNSRIFYDKGLKHTYEEPAFLSSLGLGAFEYPAGNGITGGENAFRRIGEEAAKYGIALSFHTPYFISLSGVDPEKRLKSLVYIKDSIRCAEWMGADLIVIHAGSTGKIPRDEALRPCVRHACKGAGGQSRHRRPLRRGDHGQAEPAGNA